MSKNVMSVAPVEKRHRECVAASLSRICEKAGIAIPQMEVVERLPLSKTANTACVTFRGTPKINVPAALVDKLSPDALDSLLTHELGHIVLRSSSWVRWRGVFLGFFGLFAVTFAYFWIRSMPSNSDPFAGIIASIGMLMCGVAVVFFVWAMRKHEAECDVFAARVIGLRGAVELMTHNAGARPLIRKKSFTAGWLATHPDPASRLAAMTVASQEARTNG